MTVANPKTGIRRLILYRIKCMCVFIAVRSFKVVMVIIVTVFIVSSGGEIKVISCFGLSFVVMRTASP
jgi:hypothetical protein